MARRKDPFNSIFCPDITFTCRNRKILRLLQSNTVQYGKTKSPGLSRDFSFYFSSIQTFIRPASRLSHA